MPIQPTVLGMSYVRLSPKLAINLRQRVQFTVARDAPLDSVVTVRKDVVVGVFDGSTGLGVFSPQIVLERYARERPHLKARSIDELIKRIMADPGEQQSGYSHEWLTESATGYYQCPQDGQIVTSNPCPEHGVATKPL